MAALSRYQVIAKTRQVFVRHWVDVDRLTIGYHRGTVRVGGELRLLRDERRDPTISIVEVVRSEIARIRDVHRVELDLANWMRGEDGRWIPKREQRIEETELNQSEAEVEEDEKEKAPS